MLSKEQAERIKEIINNDAEIQALYIDELGRTCAIGGLAKAAGIILHRSRSNASRIEQRPTLYRQLKKVFGLELREQMQIQINNDMWSQQDARRRSICDYINSITVQDEAPV